MWILHCGTYGNPVFDLQDLHYWDLVSLDLQNFFVHLNKFVSKCSFKFNSDLSQWVKIIPDEILKVIMSCQSESHSIVWAEKVGSAEKCEKEFSNLFCIIFSQIIWGSLKYHVVYRNYNTYHASELLFVTEIIFEIIEIELLYSSQTWEINYNRMSRPLKCLVINAWSSFHALKLANIAKTDIA